MLTFLFIIVVINSTFDEAPPVVHDTVVLRETVPCVSDSLCGPVEFVLDNSRVQTAVSHLYFDVVGGSDRDTSRDFGRFID